MNNPEKARKLEEADEETLLQRYCGQTPEQRKTDGMAVFRALKSKTPEEEINEVRNALLEVLENRGSPYGSKHTDNCRGVLAVACEKAGVNFDELLISLGLYRTGHIHQLVIGIKAIREDIISIFR